MSESQPVLNAEIVVGPTRSLVRKLSEVMAAVGYLQKTGKNTAQGYNYATEADVAEMMREELAKRQVFIFPSVVKCERTQVVRPGFAQDKPNRVSYATDLIMRWTFADGESGETMECDIPGCSESPGDKGVYVAMTGSEKYLLMKSFLIPTGDDPESDDNEPRGTKEDAQAVADAKLAAYREREKTQLEAISSPKPSPTTPATAPVKSAPIAPERLYTGLDARRPTPKLAPITKIAEKKGKKATFWVITWDGVEYTTFNTTMRDHLQGALDRGETVALYTSEKPNPNRPGQPYRNMDGIHRIHDTFFEDDGETPIREVSEEDFNERAADVDVEL